ncbi:4-hydroxy-tetrahydrodipicolinate synthase [Reichenbachiella faecimaris]|uniref:4-hydroxy-tetrahydrodipicolinate synthase n=1 Tax=Reichenbachiella faecimaris TaxID=692418 RepID=A0A1W2GCW2_REIFA|nr:dihydrodipicolinate synthase family protein [Reichenbachiella faecimaris]SMD34421.1 4-hydroxy-tetrahydrodipicolinate synthase [Reichenbachiella faecimaris]
MKINWQGVYPAITTKFDQNDNLDLDAFKKNLEVQLASGIHGVILGGTLGEASTLTEEEKDQLIKTTIEVTKGDIPVVINIAEQSTRGAIAAAKRAESNGANGLMLLPPMRYKADDRETVEYFKAVAASTSLPIMIYNNPVDYKIEVTIDMFEELAPIANIQAIKESTRDVTNVTRLKSKFGDRYAVLCGVDTLAVETLVNGADGWVGGLVCAFPAETVAIYELMKAGRIEEAVAINRWFMPLCELDLHPKLVQYIKLAEVAAGIGTEHVRAPRLPLIGKEREEVLAIIDAGIKSRPVLPDYKALAV